jgi:hypothetical protein
MGTVMVELWIAWNFLHDIYSGFWVWLLIHKSGKSIEESRIQKEKENTQCKLSGQPPGRHPNSALYGERSLFADMRTKHTSILSSRHQNPV